MAGRPSVGLADLEEVSRRISFEAQHGFEDACQAHGIRFAVIERIGGIEWACP